MKLVRAISGLLLLDKPQGITSQRAVTKVKHAFQAEKAGHTGSLDPLATGMLPICLGEATKFSSYLFDASKTYYVVAQLGVRTDTGDAEGNIIEQKSVDAQMLAQLDTVIKKFQGVIQQIPPMYSAIKFQGQPLYKLARKGEVIERPPREVTIYNLTRCVVAEPTQFALEVTCSKGTYIRTLIEDIGNVLGCGAHVTVLRRLQVDNFRADKMLSLEDITALAEEGKLTELDALLFPSTTLVSHLPTLIVDEQQGNRLEQGMPIKVDTILAENCVQIITVAGSFLGIGEMRAEGLLAPKRLIRFVQSKN